MLTLLTKSAPAIFLKWFHLAGHDEMVVPMGLVLYFESSMVCDSWFPKSSVEFILSSCLSKAQPEAH